MRNFWIAVVFFCGCAGSNPEADNSSDMLRCVETWDRIYSQADHSISYDQRMRQQYAAEASVGARVYLKDFCAWREFFISNGCPADEAEYRARRMAGKFRFIR